MFLLLLLPPVYATSTWYRDVDGDGYGAAFPTRPDEAPGYVSVAGDCAPTDPTIHPGAAEALDGVDNDCDGRIDADLDPTTTATVTIDGDALYGAMPAHAILCDPNGDGIDDLVLSRANDEHGVGAVSVFAGPLGAGTIAHSGADLVIEPGYTHAGSGLDCRDVDRDGYDDILIGIRGAWPGGATEGGALVLVAGDAALAGTVAASWYSDVVHARLGSVALACNLDGVGALDLVGLGADTAWVWRNAAAPTGTSWVGGADAELALGTTPAAAVCFDADGNGRDELYVGAPSAGAGGAVYVFRGLGSATGALSTGDASLTLFGPASGATGTSLAAGHDADGDGQLDLLVGSPGANGGAGRVDRVATNVAGSRLLAVASRASVRGVAGDAVGLSLASVGDVDHDGTTDWAIGGTDQAWLLAGARTSHGTTSTGAALASWLGTPGDDLGAVVAGGGDLTGSGCESLVVGSPQADTAEDIGGRAFVFDVCR